MRALLVALALCSAGCLDFSLLETPLPDAGNDLAAADRALTDAGMPLLDGSVALRDASAAPRDLTLVLHDFDVPCDAVVGSTPLGSAGPCLLDGGPNVLYLDPEPGNFLVSSPTTYTAATATFTEDNSFAAADNTVHIDVEPGGQTLTWDITFSTRMLASPSLLPATYAGAERFPTEQACHPGFDFSGFGKGCNMEYATFQVLDYTWSSSSVNFTATFEQYCDSNPHALRGCVHYHR